jgi:hypothetical protein
MDLWIFLRAWSKRDSTAFLVTMSTNTREMPVVVAYGPNG